MTLCRVDHTAHTARHDTGESALTDACQHGMAVQAAKRSPPIATTTPVFASNEDAERAVAAVAEDGRMGKNHVQTIKEYVERAEGEGVPVLVRIGETGWFAVRQSTLLTRAAAGEWAHVKCPTLDGMGATRQRRRREQRDFVCKVSILTSLCMKLAHRGLYITKYTANSRDFRKTCFSPQSRSRRNLE